MATTAGGEVRGKPSKGAHYRDLIQKMDLALEHEFYLQAACIAYAVIEDRLHSAIVKADLRSNWTLVSRIEALARVAATDPMVRAGFYDDLLAKIDSWRLDRNRLMHELAREAGSMDDAETIAKTGRDLARAACDAVTRMRRRFQKAKAETQASAQGVAG